MWKITYFDEETQVRVWYMQIGFKNYHFAVAEHNRIIKRDIELNPKKRKRTDFKVELIKQ